MPFKLFTSANHPENLCVHCLCVPNNKFSFLLPVFRTKITKTVSYSKVLELFCRKHRKMFSMHFKISANKTFSSHRSFYGSFWKTHCCRKLELTSATSKHFLASIALKNLITHVHSISRFKHQSWQWMARKSSEIH